MNVSTSVGVIVSDHSLEYTCVRKGKTLYFIGYVCILGGAKIGLESVLL